MSLFVFLGGKEQATATAKYGDSGFARMTSKGTTKANAGFFALLRMTDRKNGETKRHRSGLQPLGLDGVVTWGFAPGWYGAGLQPLFWLNWSGSDWGEGKSNDKGKGGGFGWLTAYIPTHDDETVMDGAPDRFGVVEENRQRQKQMRGFFAALRMTDEMLRMT